MKNKARKADFESFDDLNEFETQPETLPSFAEIAQEPLNALEFMDLYVCMKGNGRAHYRPSLAGLSNLPDVDVPPQYQEDVERLAAALRKDFDGVEKGLTYNGIRLRVSRLLTAEGEEWAAMRRVNALPLRLDQLRYPSHMVPLLRDLGKRDGLILLTGSTGQGKSTTAASLLFEYLENYGGIAFTIEDPVEYHMEGRRGKAGYCYQSEIKEESEWGLMLKRALRWHPRFIFVGEIRTPDCADQVLRAATTGHNVIATMHGGSMEEALEGLLQLAKIDLGERGPLLLAAGLTAVVHQTITPVGVHANFMVTEEGNPGSPIRDLIRNSRIGQTRTFADQQKALLKKDGRLFWS